VITPPKLTREQYLAFLDALPVNPSCFVLACETGDVQEIEEFLRRDPNFDVNCVSGAALNTAFENGKGSVASILLAHPNIAVNLARSKGMTSFMLACCKGDICIRLLLRDTRVKVSKRDRDGYTPLHWAAYHGHLDVIKWWIASGREMNLGTPGEWETDAIGAAS